MRRASTDGAPGTTAHRSALGRMLGTARRPVPWPRHTAHGSTIPENHCAKSGAPCSRNVRRVPSLDAPRRHGRYGRHAARASRTRRATPNAPALSSHAARARSRDSPCAPGHPMRARDMARPPYRANRSGRRRSGRMSPRQVLWRAHGSAYSPKSPREQSLGGIGVAQTAQSRTGTRAVPRSARAVLR